MHDALRHPFNLVDGVFPGLSAGQDLVYVLEKGRRQLIVIGPGDVEGRATALLKTFGMILKKGYFASTSGSLYKTGRVGRMLQSIALFFWTSAEERYRTRSAAASGCNAPHCFVGLASKYFVGKECISSGCFVGCGQIHAGSYSASD
jgi:hypothetical protein